MKLKDRQSLLAWQRYCKRIEKATYVDLSETATQQRARIARLEADSEAWFKYYFPDFAYAERAPFHKKATARVLTNPEWYEVRAWARELSKSTSTMMEVLYLILTKRKRYVLLVSNSEDNAIRLLSPYMAQLEFNQRIIHDYGVQKALGSWEASEFKTQGGAAFRALGAGQSPRGTRNDEVRPDVLLFDDIDTDEDCRNPETIKKRWSWIEDAAIGTRSISKGTLIVFCGNVIAKDCCVTRAMKFADHVDVVNIRDAQGRSTWPQKNSEAMIDRVLSQKSYFSQQKEYFNNPITEGAVFKEMHYKRLPALTQYRFLVCYIDLSYKSGSKNDFKAAVLVGRYKEEYHVVKAFLKQGTTRELAAGLIDIKTFVNDRCPIYWFAEENFLQDIILKELHEAFVQLKASIAISPDKRKKPDKFTRIEAALEPLNTTGKLFLNEAEKDNPSMKVLEDQFLAISPKSRAHDDGPDAVEGAKQKIDEKHYELAPVQFGGRQPHKNRY